LQSANVSTKVHSQSKFGTYAQHASSGTGTVRLLWLLCSVFSTNILHFCDRCQS